MEKRYVCPQCGEAAVIKGEEWEMDYNDPVLVCKKCSKEFLRPGCREIAISKIRFDDTLRVSLWAILPLLGGIALILLSLSFHGAVAVTRPKNLILGILFILAGIYLVISCLKNHNKKQAYLRAESKRSRERCADPDYKDKLVAMGYKIKKEKV